MVIVLPLCVRVLCYCLLVIFHSAEPVNKTKLKNIYFMKFLRSSIIPLPAAYPGQGRRGNRQRFWHKPVLHLEAFLLVLPEKAEKPLHLTPFNAGVRLVLTVE